MNITTDQTDTAMILHLEGRLDALTSAAFEKKALSLIQSSAQPMLIDFVSLEYISSAGLRALLIVAKELKRHDFSLALCSMHDSILEVFRISGFDSIMPVFSTIEEGLESLKTD